MKEKIKAWLILIGLFLIYFLFLGMMVWSALYYKLLFLVFIGTYFWIIFPAIILIFILYKYIKNKKKLSYTYSLIKKGMFWFLGIILFFKIMDYLINLS